MLFWTRGECWPLTNGTEASGRRLPRQLRLASLSSPAERISSPGWMCPLGWLSPVCWPRQETGPRWSWVVRADPCCGCPGRLFSPFPRSWSPPYRPAGKCAAGRSALSPWFPRPLPNPQWLIPLPVHLLNTHLPCCWVTGAEPGTEDVTVNKISRLGYRQDERHCWFIIHTRCWVWHGNGGCGNPKEGISSRPGESDKAFLTEERVKLRPEGVILAWGDC